MMDSGDDFGLKMGHWLCCSNPKMKRSCLVLPILIGGLLGGCAVPWQLRESLAGAEAVVGQAATRGPEVADPVRRARQLAWEAAVLVQNPPHPAQTWQTAKVKWRQAIQLLEAVPKADDQAAIAAQKLADYRQKYAAIAQRLQAEETAIAAFERGQTYAWQAAVTVRDANPSTADWQRATTKWQQAMQQLEAVPAQTTVFDQAQAKLREYRGNRQVVQQRLAANQTVQQAIAQFAQVAEQLKTGQTKVVLGQTAENLGISYDDYADLVRSLQQAMQALEASPAAQRHAAYPNLQARLADYEFALTIWRAYRDHQQQNRFWLNGDEFYNQLLPLSLIDSDRLFKNYSNIKIYRGSRNIKIPLKFTLWEIWDQSRLEMANLQPKPVVRS